MIRYLIDNRNRYKPERFTELLIEHIEAYLEGEQVSINEKKIENILDLNIELLKKSVSKWETQRDNARNQKEYEYLNNLIEISNAIIKADIL
ncbi:MAG TPA: hypothetical protein PLF32_10340 [Bacteroidales bacterium]|jgi:hypothetical protein|nr:hypothetical protein [Bacteroidales bacterium]